MSKQRMDAFIDCLKQLADKFPEYSEILNPIITQIEKGKIARVKRAIGRIKSEKW